MARSKKKKWKSRIKKALKLAAIGGAGYLAAKRFGGKKATVADTAASEDANIGVTHPALEGPYITKKDSVDAAPNVVKKQIIPMGAGHPIIRGNTERYNAAIAAANTPGHGTAVAPPGILNPYNPRTHVKRGMKSGGRIGAKKGGRVTGIAKRGFGRALMKGKK